MNMHPAYFEVRFRAEAPEGPWPAVFAIITAYPTTGEAWSEEESVAADRRLQEVLRGGEGAGPGGGTPRRITGFSPTTGHAEPGWAVALPFDDACDLGHRFRQDAIYWVEHDTLYVSYCDHRRGPVLVGSFRCLLEDGPAE